MNWSLHTQLILKTVGTTTEAVTVYSMRTLSSMSRWSFHCSTAVWILISTSHPNRSVSLLVTVQTDASSENITSALSTWFSSVASSATVEPLEIVRYGASVLCQYDIPTYPVRVQSHPSTPLTQMAAQKKLYHYWAQACFLLKIPQPHTHGQRQR